MLLPILLLPLLQSDGPCNDTTRKKDEDSGTTTSGEVQCPSTTIAGQTITGPKCYTDKKFRRDTLFKCEGMLKDVHCKPKGGKSWVFFYTIDDPCPTVPTTLEELQRFAKHGFNCKPPKLFDKTFDYSATVCDCVNGKAVSYHESGSSEEIDGHLVVYWDHFPDDLLPGAYENPNLILLEEIETIDPGELGSPVLLEAWASHAPAAAASLTATVRHDGRLSTQEPAGPDPVIVVPTSYEHTVTGIVSGGGFSVTSTSIGTEADSDRPATALDDLAFDGISFFVGTRGNERYHAYADGPVRWQAMDGQAFYLDPLIRWVENPFDVSLQAGASYSESAPYVSGGDTYVDVTVDNPAGVSEVGSTVYSVNVSRNHHVAQVQVFDQARVLLRKTTFAAFAQISAGNWRPSTVVERRYGPGQALPDMTITVSIAMGAAAVPLPSPMPVQGPSTDWWAVHMN